jgi:chaperonin GroES
MSAVSVQVQLKPLDNRVVVQPVEKEKTSSGGIVIPDSASQDKPMEGVIVAVGPGKIDHGQKVAMSVSVGDKVLFGKYAGSEVKYEGQAYSIMREDDILAIIQA